MVSEGYRAIMVTEDSYSRLIEMRTALSKSIGKKESISDSIKYLLQRSLISAGLEEELKEYITKIVDELKKNEEVEGVVLFGSVAKGNYNNLSDVDIMIVITGDVYKFTKKLWDLRKKILPYEEKFIEKDKYYRFSPLILRDSELTTFRPLYFDIADYGIILYERGKIVTDFLNRINKFPHKRRITSVGIELTWKD